MLQVKCNSNHLNQLSIKLTLNHTKMIKLKRTKTLLNNMKRCLVASLIHFLKNLMQTKPKIKLWILTMTGIWLRKTQIIYHRSYRHRALIKFNNYKIWISTKKINIEMKYNSWHLKSDNYNIISPYGVLQS